MAWYWIILLTVFAVHLVNIIVMLLLQLGDEKHYRIYCFTAYYPMAFVLYLLFWKRGYERSKAYYQNHGIGKWAYFFGKRPILPSEEDTENDKR